MMMRNSPEEEVNLATVALAKYRLSKYLTPTPLIDAQFGKRTFLKLECANKTKSFKVRGALNAVLANKEANKTEFVAASCGNHALALAYASNLLGVQARIIVPKFTPRNKLSGIERYHADPIVFGDTYDDAEAEARRVEKELGITCISPYNDPHIIAGTGTIGLEILEQLPRAERIIVPVSGGGLIAGVALALKSQNPFIEVIGVCAESAPSMYNIFYGMDLIPQPDSIADALSGAVERDSITIDLVKKFVDKIVLVSDAQIESAMRDTVFNYGFVAEGGGVVALAAARSIIEMDGRPTVIIITGANVDNDILLSVLNKVD